MTEHTPGPWRIEVIGVGNDEAWFELYADDELVAIVRQSEANAHLIAVAPELLEACEAAEKCVEAMCDRIDDECARTGCLCDLRGEPHSDTYRNNELAQLRAAIAKARRKDQSNG